MKYVITKDGKKFEVIKELKDKYQIKPINTEPIIVDGEIIPNPVEWFNYYVNKDFVNEVIEE